MRWYHLPRARTLRARTDRPPRGAGKLWRLKEAGLWSLEPDGYFDTGRYLTFRPPRAPKAAPPARIEPYEACEARRASGAPPPAEFYGWWSPPGAGVTFCAKEVAQYNDAAYGDHGTKIREAIDMSPRLQAHLKLADRYLLALRDGMIAAWLLRQPPRAVASAPSPAPTRSIRRPSRRRTFVFPRFECYCDRSEWPNVMPTCRLETSDLAFPFGCPLNFLINVHFMQVPAPPRAAARLGRSRLDARPCA